MNNIFDRLSNHISVQSDFQFSINIEYDLNSDKKIQNYIPTPSAVDIIEDVMLSTTASSTDRARVFVGAYGKGKSHLALMLLALLCRKEKSLYADLLSMICETKPDLCRFISDYQNSEKKLLPVVIQGSSIGLRQAFLLGLRKALQANNLDSLMPDTYFAAAIEKIDNWKSSYKITYNEFKSRISCSVSDFKAELAAFNTKYYERFITLYPELTSGSEFNPTQGLDIVELYNDVNKKIKDYGFTGIYVIYDEFSKFLTGNLKKTSSDEVEVLQYFAENCNRSGNDQMHIMLISHQSILNYVDDLPKTKMDSWRAVADRYKTISLNNSSPQMYSLTAHVIKQEARWFKDFTEKHADELKNIYDRWRLSNAFRELDEDEYKRLIYLCYPLHPITTFILPRISEKVAQNERTLFTFLSADGQRNTLPDFLNKSAADKVVLLTPDVIYDYFEPLFKAEAYNKPIHKIWKTSKTALSKIKKSNEIENCIVKIIALINILDRPELLPPTTSAVMHILENQYDSQSITTSLTNLTSEGIIRQLDSNHYLRIAEHTDENIDELINNRIAARSKITNSNRILNDYIGNKVFYPNGYNDEHEITRFFELHFVDAKEIIDGKNYDEALKRISGDGIVYAVITDEENRTEAENAICSVMQNRIMFILSSLDFDVVHLSRKYDAIKNILATSEDDILKSELAISLNDLDIALKRYVDSFTRPEYEEAAYYIGGERKMLRRRSNISKELSAICENTFTLFPTINNEASAINHLDPSKRSSSVIGIYNNSFDSRSNDKIQQYTDDINRCRAELNQIEEKLEVIDNNIKLAEDRKQEKSAQLKQYAESEKKQKRRETLNKKIDEAEKRKSLTNKSIMEEFNDKASSFFSLSLIKRAMDIIANSDFEGKDIPHINDSTIEYLINRKTCICGTHLDQGSIPYQRLIDLLQYIPPKSVSTYVAEFKKEARERLHRQQTLVEKVNDYIGSISALEDDIIEKRDELSAIDKLLSGKDVSSIVKKLNDAIRECEYTISRDKADQKKLYQKQGRLQNELQRADSEREKLINLDEKNRKIALYKEYAEQVYRELLNDYKESEEEIRNKLQDTINDIFKSIYQGGLSLSIDEKYHISVFVEDYSGDVETSTAQSISVIFAFITGIIKMARDNRNSNDQNAKLLSSEPYPLVMDAPLSAFDKRRIQSVCESLPNTAEQVIIFIKDTDGELAERFMGEKIGGRCVEEQLYSLCQRGEISKDILPAFLTNYSIESLLESDGEKWVIQNRLYTDENRIDEEAEYHDLQLRIEKALLTLSDREREIIKIRNGFYDNRVYSLEEIGIKFGVTRERIRQIEAKALIKLRHPSKRYFFER